MTVQVGFIHIMVSRLTVNALSAHGQLTVNSRSRETLVAYTVHTFIATVMLTLQDAHVKTGEYSSEK